MIGQDPEQLSEAEKSPGLSNAELAALKEREYSAAAGQSGLPTDCPICLTGFTDGQRLKLLPCEHAFCSKCTSRWFDNHTTCPMCRLDCKLSLIHI